MPPPGFHMTRYFGVFANRHHLRPRSIPSAAPMPGQQLALGLADSANLKPGDDTPSSPGPRRLGGPLRQAALKSTRTRPPVRPRVHASRTVLSRGAEPEREKRGRSGPWVR
ncbi:MAG: hypothetical protein JNK56_34080 [Myxococcales bacterium]|nr:hypothetical protein [Myxococcales bacterium]